MDLVERSISIASPKVLERNRIRLPSCDQSARAPKLVSRVVCDGRCSAGVSPGVVVGTAAMSSKERRGCMGVGFYQSPASLTDFDRVRLRLGELRIDQLLRVAVHVILERLPRRG